MKNVNRAILPRRCRGFSLSHDVAPVIAINTWYRPSARVFSYIHELGHLLRRHDYVCGDAGDTAVERWCDSFASAFLLPESALLFFLDRIESLGVGVHFHF